MSKDKELEVGGEILSYCGRCKLALAHTIITLNKKGNADKCECNTCGAAHKYRDPEKALKKKTGAKKAPKKEKVTPEALWKKAIAETKGLSQPYKMNGDFSEGDLIEHSTFGKGVVEQLISEKKIRVIFEEGEKILVHNY
jgi:hypothetical protein